MNYIISLLFSINLFGAYDELPQILNEQSFAEMTTYRLKKPEIAWVNRKYFEENYLEIPSGEINKEFEEFLFSKWAYFCGGGRGESQASCSNRF